MIVEAGVVNAADLVEAKEAVSVAEVVVNVSADANAVSLAALAERPSDSDRQDRESAVSAGDDFAVQTRSIPISAAAALSSKKNAYGSSSTRRRAPGAPQCGCAIC
jgi:predicted RNA-binding protein with RPS1 domain